MSEKIQAELSAQRQRKNSAMVEKAGAIEVIERADKIILESTSVIMALEFAVKEIAPPDAPPPGATTAPPDTGATVETEPA